LIRAPRNVIHRFSRIFDYGVVGNGAADGGIAFSFQLNDLPASTEFTTLYDSYQFSHVEVFVDCTSSERTTTTFGSAWPTIYIWPDYDDVTAPATLAVAEQTMLAERLTFSNSKTTFKRSVQPRIAGVAVTTGGGATGGVINMRPPWLDCGLPGVPHYGVKLWMKNYNTTSFNGVQLNISFRYHFACRNPR